MRKQKLALVTFLVAMLSAFCVMFAVACNKAEKFTITWDVDSHATVAVEGYETLPETLELEKDTEITFTVTPAEHYEIKSVTAGRTALTADGNTYKYTVSKDETITVVSREKLESVSVTKNPTKLSYYAGEALDNTGMEVTATYETGTSKVVTDYKINYTAGSAFSIGDTSFTVTYDVDTSTPKTSAAVNLALDYTATAVEALVEIKPVGGVIDETIVAAWEAREDLHNWAVDEEDMISFTFSALASDITLPDSTQILVGDGTKFSLIGWKDAADNTYGKIDKSTVVSLSLSADWNAVLVEWKGFDLQVIEGVPTLLMTLELNTDFSAYLFLLEGSQHLELKGDDIVGTAGQTVIVKFDLRKMTTATDEDGNPVNLAGAWMDIRVNTTLNGIELTNTFAVDHSDPIVNVGQMIHDDNYCYRFITHHSGNNDNLKIYFRDYKYSYDMAVADKDGKPTLTFTGDVNTNLANFAANSDISLTINSVKAEGKVAADGTWSLSYDLSEFANGEFTINGALECKNGDQTVFSEALNLSSCGTILEYDPNGIDPHWYKQSYVAANGAEYSIGVDWNNPYLVVNDHASDYTMTGGVDANGNATVTFSGVTQKYAGKTVYIDFEVSGLDSKYVVIGADGAWSATFVLDPDSETYKYPLETNGYAHFKIVESEAEKDKVLYSGDSNSNLLNSNCVNTDLVPTNIGLIEGLGAIAIPNEEGNVVYYVGQGKWGGIVLWAVDPTRYMNVTSVELQTEGTGAEAKLYYVVNYEYGPAYSKADIEALTCYFDLQGNPYMSSGYGTWGGDWTNYKFDATITVNESAGTFAVKFDISGINATADEYEKYNGYWFTTHLNLGSDSSADFKPAIDSFTGDVVEFNGKFYQLSYVKGGGNNDCYGCVGLEMADTDPSVEEAE